MERENFSSTPKDEGILQNRSTNSSCGSSSSGSPELCHKLEGANLGGKSGHDASACNVATSPIKPANPEEISTLFSGPSDQKSGSAAARDTKIIMGMFWSRPGASSTPRNSSKGGRGMNRSVTLDDSKRNIGFDKNCKWSTENEIEDIEMSDADAEVASFTNENKQKKRNSDEYEDSRPASGGVSLLGNKENTRKRRKVDDLHKKFFRPNSAPSLQVVGDQQSSPQKLPVISESNESMDLTSFKCLMVSEDKENSGVSQDNSLEMVLTNVLPREFTNSDVSFGNKDSEDGSTSKSNNMSEYSSPNSSRKARGFTISRNHTEDMGSTVMKMTMMRNCDDNKICDFSRDCQLKNYQKGSPVRYITAATMEKILEGKLLLKEDDFVIVDCRFPFEFKGGHIKGAKNLWLPSLVQDYFFKNLATIWSSRDPTRFPPIVIFHCEYSSKRAPAMLQWMLNQDRSMNQYPHLHFPELYVLDGGYKNFYETTDKKFCVPPAYLSEQTKAHLVDDVKCTKKRKQEFGKKAPVEREFQKFDSEPSEGRPNRNLW